MCAILRGNVGISSEGFGCQSVPFPVSHFLCHHRTQGMVRPACPPLKPGPLPPPPPPWLVKTCTQQPTSGHGPAGGEAALAWRCCSFPSHHNNTHPSPSDAPRHQCRPPGMAQPVVGRPWPDAPAASGGQGLSTPPWQSSRRGPRPSTPCSRSSSGCRRCPSSRAPCSASLEGRNVADIEAHNLTAAPLISYPPLCLLTPSAGACKFAQCETHPSTARRRPISTCPRSFPLHLSAPPPHLATACAV